MEPTAVLPPSRRWPLVLVQHLSRALAAAGMCLGAPVDPRAVAVRADGSPVLSVTGGGRHDPHRAPRPSGAPPVASEPLPRVPRPRESVEVPAGS